jgi:hypothetical protein
LSTGHDDPTVDPQQDYTLVSATESGGLVTYVITRKLDTGDSTRDVKFVLGRAMHYSWAYGENNSWTEHPDAGYGSGAFTINTDGTFVVAYGSPIGSFFFWHAILLYIGWGVFSFGNIITARYL